MKKIESYACYNKDNDIRIESSSGAIFSLLADYIFEKNGIVYGVAMSDDCYSAEFISVTDQHGMEKLRGSKYLQAKMGNTYKKIKKDVVEGRIVLFSGTGCQINGLKNFLGRDYENLICMDIICHGVPSAKLWRKYVEYQEKKYNTKLKTVNFRYKNVSWEDFGIKENKVYISKEKDAYMQMFLRDYCLRPSCYECVAKNVKMSDITVADFWGINNIAPEMNDERGTSLVLIRTDKGKKIFDRVKGKMNIKEVSYEDGVRSNPAEYKSAVRPVEREYFFEDMNCMSFDELKEKYATPIPMSFTSKMKRKTKKVLKQLLQRRGG